MTIFLHPVDALSGNTGSLDRHQSTRHIHAIVQIIVEEGVTVGLFRSSPKPTRREPLPKTLRTKILERDGYKCRYCGRKLPASYLHIDHVVPVALGGSNHEKNLVTACRDCNLSKGAANVRGRSVSKKVRNFQKHRKEVAKREIRWLKQIEKKARRSDRKLIRSRVKELEKVAGRSRRWWLLWLK